MLSVAIINAPTSEGVVANTINLLYDGDPDRLVLKVVVGKPALVEHVGFVLST